MNRRRCRAARSASAWLPCGWASNSVRACMVLANLQLRGALSGAARAALRLRYAGSGRGPLVITTSGCVLQGDRLALGRRARPRCARPCDDAVGDQGPCDGCELCSRHAVDRARRGRLSRIPARPLAPASPRALCERDPHHGRADRDALVLGDRAAGGASTTIRTKVSASPCCRSGSTPRAPTDAFDQRRLSSSRR